jgi:hypothetical protein
MAQVRKRNHIFTYTQLLRSLVADVQTRAVHQPVESNATFFPKTHVTSVVLFMKGLVLELCA